MPESKPENPTTGTPLPRDTPPPDDDGPKSGAYPVVSGKQSLSGENPHRMMTARKAAPIP